MIQNDATRRHPPIEVEQGASRGQIIIMFAFFVTAMFGVLGLVVDLGMAFAERRTMQNAADLGAIAGARAIARYTTANPTSALADVQTIVSGNSMANAPTINSCNYVNDSNVNVADCSSNVPNSATGVRVAVSETHPTYFIRVIPGAPTTVSTSATATAHVRMAVSGTNGPFIVCGFSAWDVTGDTNTKSGGTTRNILSSTSPLKIDPAAVGKVFRVHDPKMDQKGADCKSKASRFKGLADQDSNSDNTVPSWFNYDTGTKAGPTRTRVYGTEGCAANTPEPYNCIMILPIGTDDPAESGNSKQIYVIGFAAFRITTVDSNSHNGQLLDDYIVSGPSTGGWTRDAGGVVVIKLTN